MGILVWRSHGKLGCFSEACGPVCSSSTTSIHRTLEATRDDRPDLEVAPGKAYVLPFARPAFCVCDVMNNVFQPSFRVAEVCIAS